MINETQATPAPVPENLSGEVATPQQPTGTAPEPTGPTEPAPTTMPQKIIDPETGRELSPADVFAMRASLTRRNQELADQRRQFEEGYGQYVQLVDFLDAHPQLRDEFLGKVRDQVYGPQGQPQPPAQPGAQPRMPDPTVAALQREVQMLKMERQRELKARYDNEALQKWDEGGKLWKQVTGNDMTVEDRYSVLDYLRANDSADVIGGILAMQRDNLLGRQAEQLAAGIKQAQEFAQQGSVQGTATNQGVPTNWQTKSLEDAIRDGRLAAGGSIDEDYNPYVDDGTTFSR